MSIFVIVVVRNWRQHSREKQDNASHSKVINSPGEFRLFE